MNILGNEWEIVEIIVLICYDNGYGVEEWVRFRNLVLNR